ncbi:unnamed protein product, partial [Porites evermanni]
KSQNLIPANCNLAFLRSFFFELRSEVMCSSCSSVTSTTTMETILPLHITKGCTVQSFLKDYSHPVELESSYYCSRFQNDGKKLGNLIDYKEKVFFPEHHNSSDKGTTATDVSYQLKAVIVHEGTKISSGHYICYFKRGDEWYYSSDATIRQSSALKATSQEAYLLFYEKDDIED